MHLLTNSSYVFLSWKPPPQHHRNGVINGYYVEISEVNSTTTFNYRTEEDYLLVDDLQQDVVYKCRVAAFTVAMGPFSNFTFVLKESSTTGSGSCPTDSMIHCKRKSSIQMQNSLHHKCCAYKLRLCISYRLKS